MSTQDVVLFVNSQGQGYTRILNTQCNHRLANRFSIGLNPSLSSLLWWIPPQNSLLLAFKFIFIHFLFFCACPVLALVDQAGLTLRDPPAPASRVLGLKVCSTNACLPQSTLKGWFFFWIVAVILAFTHRIFSWHLFHGHIPYVLNQYLGGWGSGVIFP